MSNKNQQASSPAAFFGGGGDLFKNLAIEEERKKLAAAKAAPQPPGSERPGMNDQPRPGLPAARPSAPLSPVRDVAAAGLGTKDSKSGAAVNASGDSRSEEEKRRNAVAAMDKSLERLALPKGSSEPGVVDKAAGVVSDWWKSQEARRKGTLR